MRPLKRILCIMIAILMMVTMIPGNYLFAAPGDTEDDPIPYNRNDTTNFPQYPNEGYVRVDKKAVWLEDEDNIAKVTMTLDGAGVKQGTDAVLVIDRSGSMDDNVNVTRTYEKEVEVEKQVPYNEVQLTYNASNVSHQYEERYLLILYRWQTATSNVSITLTAYVDDDGNYKGYKNVSVSGFHSTDRNYRLNSSSSSFSSWSQISNNNCANALISIFGGRTAAATVKGKNVNVIFPTTRSLLQSTQSSYTVMVKEMQTISETTSVKKMNNAKEAAKAFVDALLPEGNEDTLNRIAVVSYSSSGYGKGTAFEDSALTNDNASLKSAINGIAATGGTHIQAGIKMAQDILSESNAVNKYIVLVSDGEPTFSYRANAARQRTQTDLDLNYPSDTNYVLTSFTTNVVGSGSDYGYYKSGWLGGFDYRYYVGSYRVIDNGIPTISQALMAKQAGIKIYTVGFDVSNNSDAKYTMEYVASDKDMFYLTTDDLSGVFTEIAGRIAKAGTDARVNGLASISSDGGYYFTILNDSKHPITAKPGSATLNDNAITWNLGDITESAAELTYYIKLNLSGDVVLPPDAMLSTGEIASVVYKNYRGVWAERTFPDPKLSAGGGTLNVKYYLSDEDGKPINNDGEVIPYKERVILYDNEGESIGLGETISASSYAKPFKDHEVQSNTAQDENGNTLSDSILVTRSTIYLNFPYYPMPKESKLKNFSMYKFDGNEPAPTAGLETIEKMTYIFGLKLELGSKELELNISADNGGNIDVNSFRLYDENNDIMNFYDYMFVSKVGNKCILGFKSDTDMESEKDYTIIYNVKNNNVGNYKMYIDGGDLLVSEPESVSKELQIEVTKTKDIQ